MNDDELAEFVRRFLPVADPNPTASELARALVRDCLRRRNRRAMAVHNLAARRKK